MNILSNIDVTHLVNWGFFLLCAVGGVLLLFWGVHLIVRDHTLCGVLAMLGMIVVLRVAMLAEYNAIDYDVARTEEKFRAELEQCAETTKSDENSIIVAVEQDSNENIVITLDDEGKLVSIVKESA